MLNYGINQRLIKDGSISEPLMTPVKNELGVTYLLVATIIIIHIVALIGGQVPVDLVHVSNRLVNVDYRPYLSQSFIEPANYSQNTFIPKSRSLDSCFKNILRQSSDRD